MKHLITIACTFWLLAACSGISQFVYYEPQANGWKRGSPAAGEPDYEVYVRHNGYAISIYAMILSTELKSVGPPLLPLIPVAGKNEQAGFYEPDTVSACVRFFWTNQFNANIDFSRIKLTINNHDVFPRSAYRLPHSSLENKTLVSLRQAVRVLSEQEKEQERDQFISYQLVFPWMDEKPDSFAMIIPTNAIQVNGESVPATIIYFRKKSVSKYQYFP